MRERERERERERGENQFIETHMFQMSDHF